MLDELSKVDRIMQPLYVCIHVTMPCSASACNENPSLGFFLMMDCSGWLLLGSGEGLSPCCRVKYHVCAQRENIPGGPMISSGHSCSPHPHCNGIVLGLSCPARPPTLQPLASLTALPFSCLSTTPRLRWLRVGGGQEDEAGSGATTTFKSFENDKNALLVQ